MRLQSDTVSAPTGPENRTFKLNLEQNPPVLQAWLQSSANGLAEKEKVSLNKFIVFRLRLHFS